MQPWGERTTTELVVAARAGDQRAWSEIMARFGGLVRTVIGSFRLQDADAADAAQNTWLRAVERLDTVREPERLAGWLRTTARRECLALPALTRREVPDETLTDQLVETSPGPEAAFLDDEAGRAVRAAVDGAQRAPPPPGRRPVLRAARRLRGRLPGHRHAGGQHRTHPGAGAGVAAHDPGAHRLRPGRDRGSPRRRRGRRAPRPSAGRARPPARTRPILDAERPLPLAAG